MFIQCTLKYNIFAVLFEKFDVDTFIVERIERADLDSL